MVSKPTRSAEVDRALNDAGADEVVEVLRAVLRDRYGAYEIELFLVDLRLVMLHPVLDGGERTIQVAGTPAGRAYCDQAPVVEIEGGTTVLHLPVSVHGDRLGVLRVHLPGEAADETRAELEEIAEKAARALFTADFVTDRYRRARRPRRLTLAAEMQWQLLPLRAMHTERYRLAGQLEPAYAVRGDNFDWVQDGESLTVAVTNGMGESLTAAMLTTLVITAMRNARRSGASLVDQAVLADQALWSHHAGEQYVSTLLMQLDLGTGRVLAIDAGSPRIWRVREEEVTPVELEAQLPLGMLEGTEYEVQEFRLDPGDRLFVLSDGIYGAVLNDRNYSTSSLRRTLRSSRLLPPGEAIRALMSDLRVFLQDHDLDDDAVAVCIDWPGPA